MSADTVTKPIPLTTESKSARKKRAKAEGAGQGDAAPTAAANTSAELDSSAEPSTNGDSSSYESPYVKELQKNMRNISKKLNLMTKLDAILAENPNTSLDDLVASRKINNDQKAQALKKPALQSSLKELEDQIAQYKKVDADYQSRMSNERETLTSGHKSEIEQLKQQLKKEAETESRSALRKKLLTFSQFLRAAAAKRANEEEAESEESKAFEGALLLVYGGDDKAVDAAENLIEGSDEAVPSVEGQPTSIKYSQIKEASLSHGPFTEEETSVEAVNDSAASVVQSLEPQESAPVSDPTIAHAGLTELGGLSLTNGVSAEETEGLKSPVEASTGDDSANLAAQTGWDNNGTTNGAEDALDESFEMVPRNPSETETPHEPGATNATSSWADETNAAASVEQTQSVVPETAVVTGGFAEPAEGAAATPENDGFLEVERRGRGRGDGPHRGRGRGHGRGGRGGEFRGRGDHHGGEHRGRGEHHGGEHRGGRGGFRGERRGGGEGGRGRGSRGRGGPDHAPRGASSS